MIKTLTYHRRCTVIVPGEGEFYIPDQVSECQQKYADGGTEFPTFKSFSRGFARTLRLVGDGSIAEFAD